MGILMAASSVIGATSTGAVTPVSATDSFPIVELRQYTLVKGKRDVLIDLFEREFVETQEAVGLKVVATFIDLDDPDKFVWVRGFKNMDARLEGLSAFYGGPVWKAHREVANGTMVDSDNVLLLRAPTGQAQFALPIERPAIGSSTKSGLVTATIYYLKGGTSEAAELFAGQVAPRLAEQGAAPLAWYVTEDSPNNFPRLPVREGEAVLVWFAAFADESERVAHRAAFESAYSAIARLFSREPETLRLKPTTRSLIRGASVAP
jgi:hypothetical protein